MQSAAVTMPNGDVGDVRSGASGVNSGASGASANANINARSWGDFTGAGKGNATQLDIWTFLGVDSSALFTVTVLDLPRLRRGYHHGPH